MFTIKDTISTDMSIKTTKESDYLRTLAAWFQRMGTVNDFEVGSQNCGEVARHLERIAEKLRLLEAHDHMITGKKNGN